MKSTSSIDGAMGIAHHDCRVRDACAPPPSEAYPLVIGARRYRYDSDNNRKVLI